MPASVGIVWGVPDGRRGLRLVTDLSPLGEAEPYGECLTHLRGHFELWESWRRLGPAGLRRLGLPAAIASHEYDDFPRGRVVFHADRIRFTLYADPRLWCPPVLGSIFGTFGLAPSWCDVHADLHYRTACPKPNDDQPVDAAQGTALHARPRNEPGYPTLIVPTSAARLRSGGVCMSARRSHHSGGGLT